MAGKSYCGIHADGRGSKLLTIQRVWNYRRKVLILETTSSGA